jgi:DNA replication protein DnaC
MIDAAPCPFDQCDGSGLIIDEDARESRPCRCRPARLERRRAQRVSGVIPAKYRGVSFDRAPISDMPAPQLRVVQTFIRDLGENLKRGRGLWLHGGVGTGKTTLAMLISHTALELGYTVAIYSLPRLLNEIRATYDSRDYLAFFERLEAVDLLHLDDVGSERSTPWVLEQLYLLINARYEAERSLLVTTNLEAAAAEDDTTIFYRRPTKPQPRRGHGDEDGEAPTTLEDQIGERTVSRLEEMCTVLPMYGKDARKFVA